MSELSQGCEQTSANTKLMPNSSAYSLKVFDPTDIMKHQRFLTHQSTQILNVSQQVYLNAAISKQPNATSRKLLSSGRASANQSLDVRSIKGQ